MKCRETSATSDLAVEAIRQRPDFDQLVQQLRVQRVAGKGRDPFKAARTYRGAGCSQCGGTGFNGRVGLFEIFEVDDEIRRMIMQRQDAAAIRSVASGRGMKTLFQDGVAKVLMGETTFEEIQRAAL